jgi:uncharacterized membrane protein
MDSDKDKISQLQQKLDELSRRQNAIGSDIQELQNELRNLTPTEDVIPISDFIEPELIFAEEIQAYPPTDKVGAEPLPKYTKPEPSTFSLEKFVGENLLNKVGIAILILGVAIGAKYAIDHSLISPLVRIILGYATGLATLGVALKLKQKYANYSAVLLGGSMTMLYFITYAAYHFYQLYPLGLTFTLLLVITIATVAFAWWYELEIIALIGMVGAYAVPMLLSENSGRVELLFSYMALINLGILFLATIRQWKILFNAAFVLTWFIYFTWYLDSHFGPYHKVALIFAAINFIVFYAAILFYKWRTAGKFAMSEIGFVLVNSSLFCFTGLDILRDSGHPYSDFAGTFVFVNGAIHYMVERMYTTKKEYDKALSQLLLGLFWIFTALTIVVQFDGDWITIFWSLEACLLLFIAVRNKEPFYERLSAPIFILAFFSLMMDWIGINSSLSAWKTPCFNLDFLYGLMSIAAFGGMTYLYHSRQNVFPETRWNFLRKWMVSVVFILATYICFRFEVMRYFEYKWSLGGYGNYKWQRSETVWVMNYTLIFFSILGWIVMRIKAIDRVRYFSIEILALALIGFLINGFSTLNNLVVNDVLTENDSLHSSGLYLFAIRWCSYAAVFLALWTIHKVARSFAISKEAHIGIQLFTHFWVLVVLSNLLLFATIHVTGKVNTSLLLSILWGVYAIALVFWGIRKALPHFRIAGIVLLALTLLKIFIIDLARMETIARSLIFIAMGVLLLVASFFYVKFKDKI